MNAVFSAGSMTLAQASRIGEEPPMKTIIFAVLFAMTFTAQASAGAATPSASLSAGQTTTARATCTVKVKEASHVTVRAK